MVVFLDRFLGVEFLFTIIGAVLGVAAGFMNAYRLLQKSMEGEDDGGGSKGSS